MLKTGYNCFKKVYLATGFTDLRCGVNALSAKVEYSFGHKPYDKDVLYLFCGKRNDRIKGLVWEGLSEHFCYPHIFVGSYAS